MILGSLGSTDAKRTTPQLAREPQAIQARHRMDGQRQGAAGDGRVLP